MTLRVTNAVLLHRLLTFFMDTGFGPTTMRPFVVAALSRELEPITARCLEQMRDWMTPRGKKAETFLENRIAVAVVLMTQARTTPSLAGVEIDADDVVAGDPDLGWLSCCCDLWSSPAPTSYRYEEIMSSVREISPDIDLQLDLSPSHN